uniref:Uncharacterized protein n=1 Tax=Anguilla anguilla TaxID=7936 RepID=A0A0E9WL16_ANGAN
MNRNRILFLFRTVASTKMSFSTGKKTKQDKTKNCWFSYRTQELDLTSCLCSYISLQTLWVFFKPRATCIMF